MDECYRSHATRQVPKAVGAWSPSRCGWAAPTECFGAAGRPGAVWPRRALAAGQCSAAFDTEQRLRLRPPAPGGAYESGCAVQVDGGMGSIEPRGVVEVIFPRGSLLV